MHMGTYSNLLSSSTSFARLLEDINQHKQERQPVTLRKQVSMVGSLSSEKEEEEELLSLPTNIEIQQEGKVKWSVYISYLRAGVGVVLGLLLVLTIFPAQQATSLYANWWLAEWSNDGSQRQRIHSNCTSIRDHKTNKIGLMSETEWNAHQNRRFYTFCG